MLQVPHLYFAVIFKRVLVYYACSYCLLTLPYFSYTDSLQGLICYGILIMLSSLSLVKVLTSLPFLLQKTVVAVDLLCSKCRKKVMKLISTVEGINSIVLDPSKNTVTVIGEADPVCIIKKVRKFRSSAQIISIGPPKEEKKDERKEAIVSLPRTCQKCDVWYVVGQDYTPCHIL